MANSTTTTLLTSCPQDVLEHIIAWLPKGAPLRAVQLSCSSLRAAFMNIEPTFDNLEVIVAHRVENFQQNCLRGPEELAELHEFASKCRFATDALLAAAEGSIAPRRSDAENLRATLEAELESIIPIIEEGRRALEMIRKQDLDELRCYMMPPDIIRIVAIPVIALCNGTVPKDKDWSKEFRVLCSNGRFIQKMLDLDIDTIATDNPRLIANVSKLVADPSFDINKAKMVSRCGHSLAVWVRSASIRGQKAHEMGPAMFEYKQLTKEMDMLSAKATAISRVTITLDGMPRKKLQTSEVLRRQSIDGMWSRGYRCLDLERREALSSRPLLLQSYESEVVSLLCLCENDQRSAHRTHEHREHLLLREISAEATERVSIMQEYNNSARRMRAPTKRDLRNLRPSVSATTWTPPAVLAVRRLKEAAALPPHMQKLLQKAGNKA